MTTTTLRLGVGKTSVAAFYGDNGAHGIGFFPAPKGTKSGEVWSSHEKISEIESSDCFLLITATNLESLQVMIDQLQKVKTRMKQDMGELAKPSTAGFVRKY